MSQIRTYNKIARAKLSVELIGKLNSSGTKGFGTLTKHQGGFVIDPRYLKNDKR